MALALDLPAPNGLVTDLILGWCGRLSVVCPSAWRAIPCGSRHGFPGRTVVEPQLVTAHRVRTGAPEAEQLKDTKSEPTKALHTLRYRPLLCGTGAELGDRGLLRWQQVPPALTAAPGVGGANVDPPGSPEGCGWPKEALWGMPTGDRLPALGSTAETRMTE